MTNDFTAYLDALRPMEHQMRACYDGRVAWMPGNVYVQWLVLGGTFVLELLRGALDGANGYGQVGYSWHDPVFAMRGTINAVDTRSR
jgi:hypothetical protein